MPRKATCNCNKCAKCKNREKQYLRYQAKTIEERRELIARRDPDKVKASDNARYYRDWEKRRAAADQYQQDHPDNVLKAKKRWIERNPEKRRAQITANNAVRDGKLIRQSCELEHTGNCNGRINKHHEDYSKPLEVRWLCARHHSQQHRKADS